MLAREAESLRPGLDRWRTARGSASLVTKTGDRLELPRFLDFASLATPTAPRRCLAPARPRVCRHVHVPPALAEPAVPARRTARGRPLVDVPRGHLCRLHRALLGLGVPDLERARLGVERKTCVRARARAAPGVVAAWAALDQVVLPLESVRAGLSSGVALTRPQIPRPGAGGAGRVPLRARQDDAARMRRHARSSLYVRAPSLVSEPN